MNSDYTDISKMISELKAEAVNEFVERVKELSISKGVFPVITKNILETVKEEMGVGDNGSK